MKGFYHRNEDGSIARSEGIHSPTYSLTEGNKEETFDGWKWFDTAEAAYSFFAAGDVVEITKLTLMHRLSALGKWAAFKGLLAQLPADAQDAWGLALSIRADDPIFVAYAPTIKAALELDDETFSGLLAP